MSKGKGKEVATKPDWKDQLAMIDQEVGWDEQAGSDWADSCEAASQEVFYPKPITPKHDSKSHTNKVKLTEQNPGVCSRTKQDVESDDIINNCAGWDYASCQETQGNFSNGSNHAHYKPSDSIQEGEIMSADMQRTIWEAAVQEHESVARTEHNTDALYNDDDQEDSYTIPKQQQGEEEEHIQAKNTQTGGLYHRSGSEIRYENRYACHEYLFDRAEEGKKRKREYFAQAGETGLIKDPCILLPYPQDDIPGTEDVDKPVLMVTTPEGETLYPHDMEEYPEPPAASWHGPKIGWGRAPQQGEYVVPYEDEDGPDI